MNLTKLDGISRWLMVAVFLVLGLFVLPVVAEARVLDYPSYDVDIEVNSDSTVDVTETISVRFQGTQRGVQRGITIENRGRDRYCLEAGYTCGGFEWITLLGVYDESGDPVPEDEYEVGILTEEDTEQSYFRIRWTMWPDGRLHDGSEVVTWQVKYRLFGSIGLIGEDRDSLAPILYWNALPEDRGGPIDSTTINIILPENTEPDLDRLTVFFDTDNTYYYEFEGNVIRLTSEDLPSYGNYTVSYEMPAYSVDIPARMTYFSGLPWFGIGVKVDGQDLGDVGGSLDSFPTGEHEIEFYYSGYESKVVNVDARPAESLELDASLNPTPLMWFLIVGSLALNVVGLVLIPVGAIWVYLRWKHRGKDINMPKTIIPLFHPPKGVQPYMLGSLRDEKVDREDVTGTIIDLAYRGYIKIKEIKKEKNYELKKLDGNPKDSGLNEFEEQLIEDLFGKKDTVETKDVGKRFAPRYQKLVRMAYKEMVERGYFKRSPEQTRGIYIGAGSGITALGVALSVILAIAGVAIMGIIGPVLIGVAVLVIGISLLIVSPFMPAKTTKGSKVLAEVKGFYMYMHRAERYRVQGLNPDEFEKYLSYAIVFGIEESWAEKFADIYKGQPDWYEGTTAVYDAFWLSRFTHSFSSAMNTTAYTTVTTGSASGSGWSGGGGSFGGFSGGGGGGGFSGGF